MAENRDIILFCHTSTERLGQQIAELSDNGNASVKIIFRKDVKWNKFPDEFPNLFIQNLKDCLGKNVAFLGSFHSPFTVFEQISVVYSLTRYPIRSLTFVLPYFPTGTMEREDEEGQVATAMTMARILSAIPLSMMGPSKIMMFDIHSLQERFYFSDNVLPQLCTAMPNFVATLEKERPVTIAFPDEGAHKRFKLHFTKFPIIRCIKARHKDKREVTIVEGKAKGHHVVIVDDLIMSGGTVVECVGALKKAGATAVSAYVTHAVFPRDTWRQFTDRDGEVKLSNFWITDSLPHAYEIAKHPPFKLLSLAGEIKNMLEKETFCIPNKEDIKFVVEIEKVGNCRLSVDMLGLASDERLEFKQACLAHACGRQLYENSG